jgi:hypothetical protein
MSEVVPSRITPIETQSRPNRRSRTWTSPDFARSLVVDVDGSKYENPTGTHQLAGGRDVLIGRIAPKAMIRASG